MGGGDGDARPLWARVEADLRRRIDDGEFRDRFPTDAELVEAYGVSRHTAREAVRRLTADGLVVRERGRGTALTGRRLDQPLGPLYSLFESVEAGGLDQHSELLEECRCTDPAVAARLGLPPRTPLTLVARLRRAGGQPLAVDRAWLPAEVGEGLLGTDWTRTSLYERLVATGGRRPDGGWERIRPVVPDAGDLARLGLPAGSAVFCVERLGLVGDRPVEWRRSLVRGDRFAVVSDWSAGHGGSELRLTSDD